MNFLFLQATGQTIAGMTMGAFIASYGTLTAAKSGITASIPGVGWLFIGGGVATFSYTIGVKRIWY